jgi:carboxyl-terminal processing protease
MQQKNTSAETIHQNINDENKKHEDINLVLDNSDKDITNDTLKKKTPRWIFFVWLVIALIMLILVFFVPVVLKSPLVKTSPSNQTTPADLNKQRAEIEQYLEQNFNGDRPSKEDKQKGELKGLVGSYGDVYTKYFSCEEYEKFQNELDQKFEGIGVIFNEGEKGIQIVDTIENSPARKAGLEKNDLLLAVNDVEIENLSFQEVIDRILGTAGTTVKIKVSRENKLQNKIDIKEFSIVRSKIDIPVLKVTYQDKVAIIKITSFSKDLENLMDRATQEIKSKKEINSILLDLRDNGGGLLNQSVNLLSYFLPEGQVVVQEKTKQSIDKEKTTQKKFSLVDYKLVVLVNQGTASASEITAAALKDYGRAKIVGKKTFGKGSVQYVFNLSGCDKLKVTVAEWLSPKGEVIDGIGVVPDTVFTSEQDFLTEALKQF